MFEYSKDLYRINENNLTGILFLVLICIVFDFKDCLYFLSTHRAKHLLQSKNIYINIEWMR